MEKKIYHEITRDRFEYSLFGKTTAINLSDREVYNIATGGDRYQELLERYTDEKEAKKAFEGYHSWARTDLVRGQIGWLLVGEVYSLETVEYWVDEDGEENFANDLGGDFFAEAYNGISDDEEEK